MKAVVYQKYGSPDGLHLTEMEKPAPTDEEVLIKFMRYPSMDQIGKAWWVNRCMPAWEDF
jgi:hypothetical protein